LELGSDQSFEAIKFGGEENALTQHDHNRGGLPPAVRLGEPARAGGRGKRQIWPERGLTSVSQTPSQMSVFLRLQ